MAKNYRTQCRKLNLCLANLSSTQDKEERKEVNARALHYSASRICSQEVLLKVNSDTFFDGVYYIIRYRNVTLVKVKPFVFVHCHLSGRVIVIYMVYLL